MNNLLSKEPAFAVIAVNFRTQVFIDKREIWKKKNTYWNKFLFMHEIKTDLYSTITRNGIVNWPIDMDIKRCFDLHQGLVTN